MLLPLTRTTLIVVPFTLGTAAIACLRDASMVVCWLGIAGTAPGRTPWPADGPRPLSTAGGRPQAALHGRRTAPGRSPRPADGSRSLSTAGGRPQVALHGRRTAPGRSPRPADGPAAAHATPADLLKLLPSFLIGLPACWLDLLKNLLNLLLHIATGDNQTL